MKKKFIFFFIVAAFVFVFSKPMAAQAEPDIGALKHKSCADYKFYFLSSGTVDYNWDYYYSEKIIFSSGNPTCEGFAISATTYCYSATPEYHKYKTVVSRGISIGGSAGGAAGGSAGGALSWVTDEFQCTLSYLGSWSFL